MLYGLMLDRMGLSVRNGWLDTDGKVYIYFTLEDAMQMMGCGHNKAVKLFADLDSIGLIERKKQGQGRPTRIYVKNFILPPLSAAEPEPKPPGFSEGGQTSSLGKSAFLPTQEALTSEKGKAALPGPGGLDFPKGDTNKTDKNKTELNDTEPSIHPPTPLPPKRRPAKQGRRDRMDQMDAYRALVYQNIDYYLLIQERPYERDLIDGYVELIVEVCCSGRETIRINQEDTPIDLVRSRFLKLDKDHIVYVMECLQKNTTLVGNIKAYTLSALYNAPTTIGQYYASLVAHDLAEDEQGRAGA